MIKSYFYQIALICLICVVCIGCTAKNKDYLNVAVSASTPPYSFYDTENNELIGFDIDIANEIAKRLNKKVRFETYDFNKIIYSVVSGKVDFGMESMYISKERQEILNFTIPYNYDETKIAIKEDLKDINTLEELKKADIPIAMRNGTVYPNILNKYGFDESRMKIYPTQTDLNIAILNGNASSVVSGYRRLNYLRQHMNLKIKFLEPSIVKFQASGITVNKANKKMLKQLNETLEAMIKDKTYDKIARKWLGTNPLEDYQNSLRDNK